MPPGRRLMVPAALTGTSMARAGALPSLLARSTRLPLLCTCGAAPGAPVDKRPVWIDTPGVPCSELPVSSMLPPPVVARRAPFSSRTPLSVPSTTALANRPCSAMLPLPVVMLLPPVTSTPCVALNALEPRLKSCTPRTSTLPLVVEMAVGTGTPTARRNSESSCTALPLWPVPPVPVMATSPVALSMRAPLMLTPPPAMLTSPPAPASDWPTRVSMRVPWSSTKPEGAPVCPFRIDTAPPLVMIWLLKRLVTES